ncbi:MAG: alpha/beta hydrolase [Candidatus Levybacteria bacterium]|nr:alpha/beta hydrolase [Candidatus Levybacteria bacterium]
MRSKILILHGWSYSIEKWKPFLKLLKESGVEYRVLKIPGLTAPLSNVWTLNNYTSWLLRKAKSEKRIALLGHSNGGRIVAAFAAKFPEKISHLILIDSAGIIRRDFKSLIKKHVFATAAKIGRVLTNSDSIRNLFYKAVGEEDYNKASPILKKTMLNLISQDLEPVFSKVKSPTLIIWGQNDTITPVSDGEKIYVLIQDSKLKIIENASHSPQFSHPKETSEIIIEFLNHIAI